MTLNLLILAAAAAILAAIQHEPAEAAAEPLPLDLWPGQPPGETGSIGSEQDVTRPSDHLVAGRRVIRLGSVSRPTITLYRPSHEIDTGAAVLIAPGGGYQILAWDLEGTEIAEWLASAGVTGILSREQRPDVSRTQEGRRARGAAPLPDRGPRLRASPDARARHHLARALSGLAPQPGDTPGQGDLRPPAP
jgi:hypothetical protein